MFRGSWKIARLAGIDIFVHWSFGLIIVYSLYLTWGAPVAVALNQVLLILAVFACVVMHEYGHALTARRFGIRTREITLLPIGGIARLEKMPDDPKQELLVALAGPAVNVVIAAVLAGVLFAMSGMSELANVDWISDGVVGFVAQLMAINLFLIVFNMIPAFPMDGGRVLRATLALWMDYVRATQIAATTGRVLAVGFGIAAIAFSQPFLLFIAIFVYTGAMQEYRMAQTRALLIGVPVESAMATQFRAVSPLTRLSDIAQQLVPFGQSDFPVMDGDQLVGMLFQEHLAVAMKAGQLDQNVGSVMRTDCGVVDPLDTLDQTFLRMQETQCRTLPVVRDEQVVGIISVDHISRYMMMQSARQQAAANSAANAGSHSI